MIPMMREGAAIGVLALFRDEVRLFTDKQIELATTFADQAAITAPALRSRTSTSRWNDHLIRRLARSMCSHRRSPGCCSI